jgi:hypothetical protein
MTRISLCGGDIIHLPGEVFVETVKAIKDAAGDRLTAVVSGPTADAGYLSTPKAHYEGVVEPHYAGLAVDAETQIREATCDLVKT